MLNPVRHKAVFDPDAFNKRYAVDLIGCGVSGTRIGVDLAKLGVPVRVWDDDIVSEVNLANQLYGPDDVGRLKTDAFAHLVDQQAGVTVDAQASRIAAGDHLRPVVFMAVDTMAARKEVWEECVCMNPHIDLLIDTRLGKDYGRTLCLRPRDPDHVERWEEEWYADEEADEQVCGEKITVGPTASILSGYALWMFIKWFSWKSEGGGPPPFKLSFMLDPFRVKVRS